MLPIHSAFYNADELSRQIIDLAHTAHLARLHGSEPNIDLKSGFALRLARRCLTKPEQTAQYISDLNIPARDLLKLIAVKNNSGRCLLLYDMSKSYFQEYIAGNKSAGTTHKYVVFFTRLKDWNDLYEGYLEEHFAECDDCGSWEARERFFTTYNDDSICRVCRNDNYIWCDYSDAYIHIEDTQWAIGPDGDEVRISNREAEVSGDWSWNDDRDMYVHYQYDPPSRVMHSYHSGAMDYMPIISPWVKKYQQDTAERNTPRKGQWFGVELEVECSESIKKQSEILHGKLVDHSANVLRRLAPNFDYSFFKFERDGSLSNGWEIITQPAGLDIHRAWWQWLKLEDFLLPTLSSETASSCGLHIHVNKDSLTPLAITKISGFINSPNNASLITTVARRYNQSYARIKNKGPGKTPSGKTILASPFEIYKRSNGKTVAGYKSENDRYDAFNLTNGETVEFRIFQGTLSYPRIIAALEFVYSICRYCHDSSGYGFDLTHKSFMKFINSQPMLKETQVLRNFIELNERI